jgi:CheY-like chemotaxis protein
MNSTVVNILLVEDDKLDIEATKRAFKKAKIANPVFVAKNGEEALDCLRGENGQPQIQAPYIILLDLNMPRMNGLEFLQHLRDDPRLSGSVVFVLTTSDAHQDQWAAYDKQIAGYVVKKNVGDDFMKLISMLQYYWNVVELPNGPNH